MYDVYTVRTRVQKQYIEHAKRTTHAHTEKNVITGIELTDRRRDARGWRIRIPGGSPTNDKSSEMRLSPSGLGVCLCVCVCIRVSQYVVHHAGRCL